MSSTRQTMTVLCKLGRPLAQSPSPFIHFLFHYDLSITKNYNYSYLSITRLICITLILSQKVHQENTLKVLFVTGNLL